MMLNTSHGLGARSHLFAFASPQAGARATSRLAPSVRNVGLALLVLAVGWVVLSQATGTSPEPKQGVLRVVSHSATAVEDLQVVRFEVIFDRAPDFFSLDSAGRQADSFQFYLDVLPGNGGMNGTSPYPWECVVRGEEVHAKGDVRIRDHVRGPSEDPGSGGWGPIAGSASYKLDEGRLKFTVPFSLLGTTTGEFGYSLEVYRYGASAGECSGRSSTATPEPAVAAADHASMDPGRSSLWPTPIPAWHDNDGLIAPDGLLSSFFLAFLLPLVAAGVGVCIVGARALDRRQLQWRDPRKRGRLNAAFLRVPVGRQIIRRPWIV